MFRAVVLASGSSGNAVLVSDGDTHFLVDIGVSCGRLLDTLADLGLEGGRLHGVILTHEHIDHVRGLGVFVKKFDVPVFSTSQTAHVLRHSAKPIDARWKIFEPDSDFEIGRFGIRAFPVPHDAVDPVGLVVRRGHASLGFLTDLGHTTTAVRGHMAGVHTLLVESNYDAGMLEADSKRPWRLKQRIVSRHGHLSNEDAAGLIGDLCASGLRRVVLCHLSRECNRSELAAEAVRRRLLETGGSVEILVADSSGGPLHLSMPGLPMHQTNFAF